MVVAPQVDSPLKSGVGEPSKSQEADFFLVLASFQRRLEALQQGGRLRPGSGAKAAVRGGWPPAGNLRRNTVGPITRGKEEGLHNACDPPTRHADLRRNTTDPALGSNRGQATCANADGTCAETQYSDVACQLHTTADLQETTAASLRTARATSCGPRTNSPASPASGSQVRAASCTRPQGHAFSSAAYPRHSRTMQSLSVGSQSDDRAQGRSHQRLLAHQPTHDRPTTTSPAARNLFSDREQPAFLNIPGDTELVQAGTASGPDTASPILSHSGARCNSSASGNCQQSNMGHAYIDGDCNNLHNPAQPIFHSQSEGSDGDGGPAAAAFDFLVHVQLSPRCATTGGGPSAEDLQEVTLERDELRSRLAMAESEVAWRVRSHEALKASHEAVLAALRAECDSRARGQAMEAAECARLRGELAESMRCRFESQSHAAECASLREQLTLAQAELQKARSALEEERRNRAASRDYGNSLTFSPEALAPSIAMLEVQALRTANAESRAQLKRRLQLKWHPDKCVNAALATCVMQELQQRPEWA